MAPLDMMQVYDDLMLISKSVNTTFVLLGMTITRVNLSNGSTENSEWELKRSSKVPKQQNPSHFGELKKLANIVRYFLTKRS